jgi:hypothetical protein
MSNVLIVVYSWTGTSRRLAEAMAAMQRWTLAEVHEAKPSRTAWRCIVDSFLQRRPAIRYDGPDPRGFDAVVLVSPIWVGRLAGPMRSFVAERARTLPAAVVVSVMSGRGAPGALMESSRLLQRAPILDASFTQRDVENGRCGSGIQALGNAVDAALARASMGLQPAFDPGT